MPIKPIHASSAALPSAPVSFTTDPLAWVGNMIKQIGSCSFIGKLAADCFSEKGRFTLIQYSLIGATGLGVVGSVVMLISGLPAVAALTAALSVATGTGAWMAFQAADQWALTQSIDEIKKQADVYVKQNKKYQKENRAHHQENKAQRRENHRLKSEVSRAAQNNQAQERQIEALTEEVTQHRENNAEQAEQIVQLGDEVGVHKRNNETQLSQIAQLGENLELAERHRQQLGVRNQELVTQIGLLSGLAEEFRGEIGSMKAGTKAQKAAIRAKTAELAQQITAMDSLLQQHRGGLGENLSELKGLIDRASAARLSEQGTVLESIRSAEQHLNGIREQERALLGQVSEMEGQLRASREELERLKGEHQQIIEEHRQLNAEQRTSTQNLTELAANLTGVAGAGGYSIPGVCGFQAATNFAMT